MDWLCNFDCGFYNLFIRAWDNNVFVARCGRGDFVFVVVWVQVLILNSKIYFVERNFQRRLLVRFYTSFIHKTHRPLHKYTVLCCINV